MVLNKKGSNKDYLLNPNGRVAVAHDVPLENVRKTIPKTEQEKTATPEEKPVTPLLIPRFNKIYSTLRENDTLANIADGWSSGTIATSGTFVPYTPLVINKNTPLRLSQWPDAVQVYLAIELFSISTYATGVGVTTVTVFDNGGAGAVVGTGQVGSNIISSPKTIFPTPVTDMLRDNDQTFTFGSLGMTLNNVTGAINWQYGITWSYVYLLPANESYEVHHVARDR
jgi:hypothetical protein